MHPPNGPTRPAGCRDGHPVPSDPTGPVPRNPAGTTSFTHRVRTPSSTAYGDVLAVADLRPFVATPARSTDAGAGQARHHGTHRGLSPCGRPLRGRARPHHPSRLLRQDPVDRHVARRVRGFLNSGEIIERNAHEVDVRSRSSSWKPHHHPRGTPTGRGQVRPAGHARRPWQVADGALPASPVGQPTAPGIACSTGCAGCDTDHGKQ